jgi:SAM-dependent methyltransferase
VNERDFHDHHYETEAARIRESPLFSRVHDRCARDFRRSTGIGPAHRMLSLGCGDGSIELRLAPHVGEIVGLDVSPVAIERARAGAKRAGIGNLDFRVSDPDNPRIENLGQFDFVTAFAFLHHLADPMIRETLDAARRTLRPGGVFYSADPSRRRLVGLFVRFVRAAYDRYHSPDERELDPDALLALAIGAGFTGSRIRYVDCFLGPLAWLAPGTPRWLVPILAALDDVALSVPLLRQYASSFSLTARAS